MLAAPAAALPGDPVATPLTPADGATVRPEVEIGYSTCAGGRSFSARRR